MQETKSDHVLVKKGKPYSSPRIVEFGAVSVITASGTGSYYEMAEGGGMCMRDTAAMTCL